MLTVDQFVPASFASHSPMRLPSVFAVIFISPPPGAPLVTIVIVAADGHQHFGVGRRGLAQADTREIGGERESRCGGASMIVRHGPWSGLGGKALYRRTGE
jgi:hypothetical protein